MDWSELGRACLEHFIPILGTILLGVASAAIGLACAYLRKKWGLEITAAQQAELTDAVLDGIAYVEEQAAKAVKANGKPRPSDEKLDAAVDYVSREIQRRGLPEMARDAIARLIEARIDSVRP